MLPTFALFPTSIRWIHLLAAITWVGGTIFVAVVLTPLLRRELPRQERMKLVSMVGRRFNTVGWIALSVLLTTGLYNSWLRLRVFEGLYTSTYGYILLAKLILVAIVVALTWHHSYRLAPKLEQMAAAETEPGEEALRVQGRLIRVSAVHLLLNIAIVFLAAWLSFY